MAKIKFKRSSIAGRKPASLESGEIAVNLTDRKIYAGTDNNQIIQLGNDPIITERLQAKAGATIDQGLTVGGNAHVSGTLGATGALSSTTSVKAPMGEIDALTAVSVTSDSVNATTLTATGKTTLSETKAGAVEATSVNVLGAVTSQSVMTSGSVSAGGNIVTTNKLSSGSVETGSIIATGDVSSATLTTTGKAKAGSVETGAITATNITASGKVKADSVEIDTISASGTATVRNLIITGTSNIGGGVNVTGALVGSSLETPLITTTDINTRNVTATGIVSAASVVGEAVSAGTLAATGDTTLKAVRMDSLRTGTIIGTGAASLGSVNASTITSTGNLQGKIVKATESFETVALTTTGAATVGTTLNVVGSTTLKAVSTGNVTTTGDITASGKVKAASGEIPLLTSTTISATGVITAGSMSAGSIALTDFTNFDARYIKVGTAITVAERLATPRTIAGVAFDGSANITIPAANVGAVAKAGDSMTGALSISMTAPNLQLRGAGTDTRQYIMGYKADGSSSWYVGKANNGSDDAMFHNYTGSAGVVLGSTGTARINAPAGLTTTGTVIFDALAQATYDITSLNAGTVGGKNYLRKFRGGTGDTIWHETVTGQGYRISTGSTDTQSEMLLNASGNGTAQFRGEVVSNSANGHRIAYGNIGFFLRNDGSNTYFMLTNSGDTYGSYNNLRPIIINNTSGLTSIGNGLSVSGSASFGGAVTFNNTISSSAATIMMSSNQRRHIQFHNGTQTDGYIYKDVNGAWQFNNGSNTGSWAMQVGGRFDSSGGISAGGAITNATTGAFSGIVTAAGVKLTDQNHSWIQARDNTNALRCESLATSAAGSMVVQKHASHTFTLGGLGNAQFGIYRYTNTRTENGNDGSAYFDTSNQWVVSGRGVFGGGVSVGGTLTGATTGAFSSNVTIGGTLAVTGALTGTSTGSFTDVQIRSDKRLKSNLVEVKSAIDKVKKLTAYHYDKRNEIDSDQTHKEVGIIAQDLEKVLPEAVSETESGLKTISTSAVNALVISALNELIKKVEHLEYLQLHA